MADSTYRVTQNPNKRAKEVKWSLENLGLARASRVQGRRERRSIYRGM